METAAIYAFDEERDRKTCIALDLKVTGANRELGQWLLDNPRYGNTIVAEWLGCSEFRPRQLRKWARNGFVGTPFDSINHYDHRASIGRSNPELKSLDNSESQPDPEPDAPRADPADEIADPATIEDNALYTLQRINEHARVFKKLFKASPLDREAKDRISEAIERMIQKWRSTQSTLTRREPRNG